jgi:hypothetical protein
MIPTSSDGKLQKHLERKECHFYDGFRCLIIIEGLVFGRNFFCYFFNIFNTFHILCLALSAGTALHLARASCHAMRPPDA